MRSRSATATGVTLRIGRRVFRVSSLAAASARYAEERDGSGLGASRFPEGRVLTAEGEALRVSYNGRVWRGVWPTAELLFDPAATTEIPTA